LDIIDASVLSETELTLQEIDLFVHLGMRLEVQVPI
jgi:hypothetical protein